MEKVLLKIKPTCLTGSFTCPTPLGNVICRAIDIPMLSVSCNHNTVSFTGLEIVNMLEMWQLILTLNVRGPS